MRHLLILLGLLLVGGCLETDFDSRSIVNRWRTLAIVVSEPTFRPGNVVTFQPLVVDPEGQHATPTGTLTSTDGGGLECRDGICFVWTLCLRPDRTPGLSGLQFNPEQPSQSCGGAMGFSAVPEANATLADPFIARLDGTAVLNSAFVTAFLEGDTLEMAAQQLGIPVALIERIRQDIGVTFVAELRVIEDVDGELVEHHVAFKRAIVRDDGCVSTDETPCPGYNPPPPELSVRLLRAEEDDAVWVTARGIDNPDNPFECRFCERALDGSCAPTPRAMQLVPNERYVLDPIDVPLDPDAPGTWIERYTVLDLTGELVDGQEAAYYSFLSTDGSFERSKTRAPADETIWTTPDEPGSYPLWVIVRDGQAGMSACRLDVQVGRVAM